ncbi:MAG TPA: hypothetical protein VMV92_23755 [Streptosporangiaceae bacterium]|nr:hypothetical protein [Streptosporangiaceae bacterium]
MRDETLTTAVAFLLGMLAPVTFALFLALAVLYGLFLTVGAVALEDATFQRFRGWDDPDGAVGYRCPGEPAHMYVRKGGDAADTAGRSCLCNALLANAGLGQTRRIGGYTEDPLVTLGSNAF